MRFAPLLKSPVLGEMTRVQTFVPSDQGAFDGADDSLNAATETLAGSMHQPIDQIGIGGRLQIGPLAIGRNHVGDMSAAIQGMSSCRAAASSSARCSLKIWTSRAPSFSTSSRARSSDLRCSRPEAVLRSSRIRLSRRCIRSQSSSPNLSCQNRSGSASHPSSTCSGGTSRRRPRNLRRYVSKRVCTDASTGSERLRAQVNA